jgi:hypothetical protein
MFRLLRPRFAHVVSDVARALQKLASIGFENAVVTADHGHLFFGAKRAEREEAMRIDAQVELHRRCWIGRCPSALRLLAII